MRLMQGLRGAVFTKAAVMICVVCQSSAAAGVPTYGQYELQARGNFGDGFNLPANSFFTNSSPDISNSGNVAIHLIDVGGSLAQGVWAGGGGAGAVVHQDTFDAILGDTSINDAGYVAFDQFLGGDGVYLYDPNTGGTTKIVGAGGVFGITGYGDPKLTTDNVVGFRAKSGGANLYIGDDHGVQWSPVAEVGYDAQSPYSFLFSPDMNESRQLAGKARVGASGQVGESQPDEIRLWNTDGSSVLIAIDKDGDPNSSFAGFDNSVAVNDHGQVAFIASMTLGGRWVLIGDGVNVTMIASTLHPDVSEIEFFHPAINNSGLVAFRGRDSSGLRAVFVGDGADLTVAIREHDIVPSDLGDARIDQHDSSPVFGGNVAINDCGDVVFQGGLTPPDDNQIEWGSGVFVAYAGLFGDLDGDRAIGLSDLATLLASYGVTSGATYEDGDLDGDEDVDLSDLATLLAVYGVECP